MTSIAVRDTLRTPAQGFKRTLPRLGMVLENPFGGRIEAIVCPLAVGLPGAGQEGFPFGRTQGGCIADLGYAKSADVDLFAGKNIGRLLCREASAKQPKPSTPCEQTNFSGEGGLCNHGAKVP